VDPGSASPSGATEQLGTPKIYAFFSTPKYVFSGWRPRKRPKNADAAAIFLRRILGRRRRFTATCGEAAKVRKIRTRKTSAA
jgi:hypothetical protein